VSRNVALAVLLLCGGTLIVSGCGDDEKKISRRGAGKKKKKKHKKAPGAAAAQARSAEDLFKIPPRLLNADWDKPASPVQLITEPRDPFQLYAEDLPSASGKGGPNGPTVVPGTKCPTCTVGELQLEAIITGTAVHKALMVDANDLGHVMRAGDICCDPNYRVTSVTRNEVVFKPLAKPGPGQPPEQRKRLLTEEELEQLLP